MLVVVVGVCGLVRVDGVGMFSIVVFNVMVSVVVVEVWWCCWVL